MTPTLPMSPITFSAEQMKTIYTVLPEVSKGININACDAFDYLFKYANLSNLNSSAAISRMGLHIGLLKNGAPIMHYRLDYDELMTYRYIFVTPTELVHTANPDDILPIVYHPEKKFENDISCFHDFDEKSITYFKYRINEIISNEKEELNAHGGLSIWEEEMFILFIIAYLNWHETAKEERMIKHE